MTSLSKKDLFEAFDCLDIVGLDLGQIVIGIRPNGTCIASTFGQVPDDILSRLIDNNVLLLNVSSLEYLEHVLSVVDLTVKCDLT